MNSYYHDLNLWIWSIVIGNSCLPFNVGLRDAARSKRCCEDIDRPSVGSKHVSCSSMAQTCIISVFDAGTSLSSRIFGLRKHPSASIHIFTKPRGQTETLIPNKYHLGGQNPQADTQPESSMRRQVCETTAVAADGSTNMAMRHGDTQKHWIYVLGQD